MDASGCAQRVKSFLLLSKKACVTNSTLITILQIQFNHLNSCKLYTLQKKFHEMFGLNGDSSGLCILHCHILEFIENIGNLNPLGTIVLACITPQTAPQHV